MARAWLSRCPGTLGLSLRCTAAISASEQLLPWTAAAAAVYVQISSGGSVPGGHLQCDPSSSAPALLPLAISVGATYSSPRASGSLTCQLFDASGGNDGTSLGFTSAPVRVTPSLWPVWEDAILVASSGLMRSARLGRIANVTAALEVAAAACGGVVVNASASASAAGAQQQLVDEGCGAPLVNVTWLPGAILAAAQATWGPIELPPNNSSSAATATGGFALTLTGASLIVLRAPRFAFSRDPGGVNASLSGVPCPVLAVSADGRWLLLQTPEPAALCGSATVDCGYSTLRVSTASSLGAAAQQRRRLQQQGGGGLAAYNGASLTCPPFCPGSISPPATVPAVLTPGSDAVRVALVPDAAAASAGGLALQPVLSPVSSSLGLYYSLACAQTGLYTDPSTGACTNASDPASYSCAFGAGAACSFCNPGALCPGGFRLWPRAGYWAESESALAVIPCSPPFATVRCPGWTQAGGSTQCGPGYLSGSYLCGVCASGYYPSPGGGCSPCPIVRSTWDRYQGLLQLIAGVVAFVVVAAAILYVALHWLGSTLSGSASQLVSLGVWTILALQTISQVSRVSSTTLPPLLVQLYRYAAVLQFAGIVLPPACSGA
jgi:hypothetical protein